jgi:transposase InsO family protein
LLKHLKSKPYPQNPTLRIPPDIEGKILYLRKTYQLGLLRISWFLERYHNIKVSAGGVWGVLIRNGLNRLPRNTKTRTIQTHRDVKQVPGHHVQMDLKFLTPLTPKVRKIRRFQYTAIDDATRIRALKIHNKHTKQNAIDFVDYVLSKFLFRIQTIRTDNGHEFHAKFDLHVEDLGIRQVYIKPRTPRLNGKVEQSHVTDDVDLNKKLPEWENYYDFNRPHRAFAGKTPYEALTAWLKNSNSLSAKG